MSNDENERVLGLLLIGLLLMTIVPPLAPRTAAAAGAWLCEHGILVAPPHATFTIPFLGAGPDTNRLLLVALLAIAAIALTVPKRQRDKQTIRATDHTRAAQVGKRGPRA